MKAFGQFDIYELESLMKDINDNIEYYNSVVYTNKVFKDLLHLSEEDISRLSSADIKQKDNILRELVDISYRDGDLDNLNQTMEHYRRDAINLINKATQGR